MSDRLKKSFFNLVSGMTYQVLSVISGFLVRKVFLEYIGVYYLGFDGFFGNIIAMLNLLDLGIGSASIFYMSKSFAQNNKEQVMGYYRVYSKLYKRISVIIIVIGLLFAININLVTDTSGVSINFLRVIFILQLSRSISNFLLVCPRVALQCNQRNYVNISIDCICLITFTILKILSIVWIKNYILYLILILFEIITSNLLIRFVFNKEFKICKYSQLDIKEYEKPILNYSKKIVIANINDFVYRSTDNLVITYFLGLTTVGYMSNYYYIFNAIDALFTQIYHSFSASVTNFIHDDKINTDKNIENLFYLMFYIAFVLTLFCSTFLFGLTNQFISLAFGSKYVLETSITILMVSTFILVGFQAPLSIYIISNGLMSLEVPAHIFCTILNLVVSIVLVRIVGVQGVLFGTFIATVVFLVLRVRVIFSNVLSNYTKYLLTLFKYLTIIVMNLIIVNLISNYLSDNLFSFFVRILIYGVLVCFGIVLTMKSREFIYFRNLVINIKSNTIGKR